MSLWSKITTGCTALGLLAGLSLSTEAAGLLQPANSQLPPLQIKSHHVNVVIENGYATTAVEQTFHNPNSQDLEAHYSFPLPEAAAVGEFVYWVNGKPVIGEVVPKQQGRQIYQQQKAAGKQVALTEQDDYRRFDTRVYPVRANNEVRIKLVYIQPTHVDGGMGRYLYPLEEGGVDEQQEAFWNRNDEVEEAFSFNLELRSGYPVDGLRLPQHRHARIDQYDSQHWRASLGNPAGYAEQQSKVTDSEAPTDELDGSQQIDSPAGEIGQNQNLRLDQDILVYWRLTDGLPGAVDLVSYREPGAAQGTFMLTLTPGDELKPLQGNRDWVFVLDTSGSMAGKYATLLEGVRQGLAQLPSGDRFRLITFSAQAEDLSGGYQPVDPAVIEPLLQRLQQRGVGGGTNLYAGLKRGIERLDADRSSAIVLVTDGVANVGTTEKRAFLKLLEHRDVRLFTFIMGNSANRPLLKQMTEVSNGFATSISNADDVIGQIRLATTKLNHAALRDLTIDIDGVRTSNLTPDKLPPLYRGQQLVILGHYSGDGEARIRLRGRIGADKQQYQTRIHFPEQATHHPELERLWAFAKIEALQAKQDYYAGDQAIAADTDQAITDLAVEHGLVTNHTSLLVAEQAVFDQLGIERRNQHRVEREQQARDQRHQAWQQRQGDHNAAQSDGSQAANSGTPMFNGQRASVFNGSNNSGSNNGGSNGGSGGGAVDASVLILLTSLLLSMYWCRRHRVRLYQEG